MATSPIILSDPTSPALSVSEHLTLKSLAERIANEVPSRVSRIQALEAESRVLDDECEELERKIEVARGKHNRIPVTIFSPKANQTEVLTSANKENEDQDQSWRPKLWRNWSSTKRKRAMDQRVESDKPSVKSIPASRRHTGILDDVLEATGGKRVRGLSKLFSEMDEGDEVAKMAKRLRQME